MLVVGEEVGFLPLLVLSLSLDVGDKRVEWDGGMIVVGRGEIGAELEAAMAVVVVVVGWLFGGVGDE